MSNLEDEWNRSLWLCANITLRCNRKEASKGCTHCFLHNRKDVLSQEPMSEETIYRLVGLYRDHIEKYGESRFSQFSMYGGEALLYPEKVWRAAFEFRRIDPKLLINIFTNGDFLTHEVLLWSYEIGLRINYSLNDDSIEIAQEKIKLIKLYELMSFMVVVICESSVYRLKDIIKLAVENGVPLLLNTDFTRVDEDYLAMCEKYVPEAIKSVIEEGYVFDPECFYCLFSLKNKVKFHEACGSHLFTIDPDGSVLFCECQENKVGNIWDNGFSFQELKDKYELKWQPDAVECQACEFKLICGGGCPLRKMKYFGRTDVVSPSCSMNKQVIPMMLDMKKKWKEG